MHERVVWHYSMEASGKRHLKPSQPAIRTYTHTYTPTYSKCRRQVEYAAKLGVSPGGVGRPWWIMRRRSWNGWRMVEQES